MLAVVTRALSTAVKRCAGLGAGVGAETGSATFTWKMKAAGGGGKKNGFLVLGSDEDATASLVAGSWIGSHQITVFENTGEWGKDPAVRKALDKFREDQTAAVPERP